MNNYDLKITKENIMTSLENNELNRNKFINSLLKLINLIKENAIISLDGNWGTGKSIFVKKIELINHEKSLKEKKIFNIEKDVISDFQDKYTVYYYNAWENDNHVDPLKSIIYKLICDYPKEKNQIYDNKLPINFPAFASSMTKGFIDIDKVSSYKNLVEEVITTDKIKDTLNKLLDDVSNGKRILIIIDELDRCNPAFAVKLIETIKHFYDNDKLVFLLASNNKELAHTVSKFYGEKFDGYRYLNKVYDFAFTLNKIDIKDYMDYVIKVSFANESVKSYVIGLCEEFNFEMREINRYVKCINLLTKFFDDDMILLAKEERYIIKYIFMPYCIALRVKKIETYEEFINGNEINEIISIVKKNDTIKNDISFVMKNENNEKIIKDVYSKYFVNSKNDYKIKNIRDKFIDTLSLLDNINI